MVVSGFFLLGLEEILVQKNNIPLLPPLNYKPFDFSLEIILKR